MTCVTQGTNSCKSSIAPCFLVLSTKMSHTSRQHIPKSTLIYDDLKCSTV